MECAESIVVSSVAVALVSILILAYVARRHFRLHHHHAEKSRQSTQLRIRASIASLNRLTYPASFVRGTDFVKLGHLRPHESLRDEGLLVYKDRAHRRDQRIYFMVFISHQVRRFH